MIYLYVCDIIFLTIVGVIPFVVYFLLWDLFRGIWIKQFTNIRSGSVVQIYLLYKQTTSWELVQSSFTIIQGRVFKMIASVLQYLVENPYVLGVTVLLTVFILALSVLFSGPKSAKNPFSPKHVRPVGHLVSDQKERDRVLKQSKRVYLHEILS